MAESKDKQEEKRNITWNKNQELIQQAYIKLIMELKRCPTIREVSEDIDLSILTIKKHIKELKFEPAESPLRSLTPDVLASIYNSSIKGNAASQRLWMMIMEGWTEKTSLDITGRKIIVTVEGEDDN